MDSKHAILIYGPESCGTRVLTQLFMAAGCQGDCVHRQPWEHMQPTTQTPIVWRRNFPFDAWHGTPHIPEQVALLKQGGYTVHAVVIIRDWSAAIPSAIKQGHVSNETQAHQNLRNAMLGIFDGIWRSFVPFEVITYESLVMHPQATFDSLCDRIPCELKKVNASYIRDKNKQHYLQ